MFRAFMFGLLFRYAKTGFFWAVILPALYFGSVHLYQGHDVLSALAAFGVTFIGALYFSWMYVEYMDSRRIAHTDERSMAYFHDRGHRGRGGWLDFQYCPNYQHYIGY